MIKWLTSINLCPLLCILHSRSVKSPLKPHNIDQDCESPVKMSKRSRAIIDSDDEQEMVKEAVSKQNGKPTATPGKEKVQNIFYASFYTVW